jgi:hypothetical protein
MQCLSVPASAYRASACLQCQFLAAVPVAAVNKVPVAAVPVAAVPVAAVPLPGVHDPFVACTACFQICTLGCN